jgi:DNA-binding MarR family transcriptional regulator
MREEIAQLKARILELEWENAALKAHEKRDIQDKLKREMWDVLEYFFHLPATATLITSQIASHFRLPENAAQHYLDSLVTCGFIRTLPNPVPTFRDGHVGFYYMLTPHGRAFIMANTALSSSRFHPVSWIKSRPSFSKKTTPHYIQLPHSA